MVLPVEMLLIVAFRGQDGRLYCALSPLLEESGAARIYMRNF